MAVNQSLHEEIEKTKQTLTEKGKQIIISYKSSPFTPGILAYNFVFHIIMLYSV